MQEKLQQYLTTLETLRDNEQEQEQEALTHAIRNLREELQRHSLELFSS